MQKWAVRQMCLPGGCRLPKRERWKPVYPIAHSSSFGGSAFNRFDHAVRVSPQDHSYPYEMWAASLLGHGNLKEGLYRYYMGVPNQFEMYAQCRCCMQLLTTESDRDRHGTVTKCFMYLSLAYKYLADFKACIICDRVTEHERWGVPLCPSTTPRELDCMALWKFLTLQPANLREALMIQEDQQPNAQIHEVLF